MPTLRIYTFGIYDQTYNYIGDVTLSALHFDNEEFESLKNRYLDQFGENSQTLVTTPGHDITAAGAFIKFNFFTASGILPYLTPTVSDYSPEWESVVVGLFGGLVKINSIITSIPVTSSTSTQDYRDFYLSQDGVTFFPCGTRIYTQGNDEYRGYIWSDNYSTGRLFSSYGSGTGGNTPKNYFWEIMMPYLVGDSKVFTASLSGYNGFNDGALSTYYSQLFYEWSSSTDLYNILMNSEYTEEDPTNTDPYKNGGASGTGGGTGTFSGTGDMIGIPGLPTLSATAAGFITLFNPTAGQMAQLASYMWTGAFDLDTFKKIFANPMDCILGLSIVPVDVPAGGSAEVKVGNIGTGIYMTTAASQYVEVDCGTLNVEEFWGAYLDYDPYTKAEIYMPYIGTHPIAVDDIMGKPVHVVYHVDVLSGACIAYVQCGGTVLYSFIGQCSSSIPITGNDWTNVVNGVLSIAGSIGSMVATGGATAPAAVGNIMSTAVNQMKPSVEKSGSLSGTGGMMGIQTPYLILTRPRQALPKSQNAYTGYPSFIHEDLGTLSGYTEVEEIHLENVPATDGEISEIVSLLKGGVIF